MKIFGENGLKVLRTEINVGVLWNLPIADIPNSGKNLYSQMWQSFLNYLPIVDTSQ